MRTLNRRTITRPGAVPALLAALALAAAFAAGPAVAKEGFQAFLDAPIGRDTPGGTTLLVGVSVIFPDGSVTHPVEGSPLYLELVGRDGSSVQEMGREDKSGHYVIRIEVPPAGIASVDVGVRGTSDLPIELLGPALVPGGIDSQTAQAAPALPPAPTPFARASVAPPAIAPVAAPALAPSSTPADAPSTPFVVLLVGAAALAGLLAGVGLMLAANRRSRLPGPQSSEPAPEA
jgi:hypothetical protein